MIFEHQILEYENVIIYECSSEKDKMLYSLDFISKNIDALDVKINGSIIIGCHSDKTEIIIPIDKKVCSSKIYSYKNTFKLVNAVRQRYYGAYEDIENAVETLKSYIVNNNLTSITDPYISVKSTERCVYDVFIGISENVL